MASNALVDMFRIKELRNKILFTLAMLIVFRIGATIPIPGIDINELKAFFAASAEASTGMGVTDYLDFFAGGAFKNFSIFMLGIMPYISMSIIMQLLVIVFPALKRISEEDGGRKKIQKITRYGTVVVCLIQSFTITRFATTLPPGTITIDFWQFAIIGMLTVTSGTLFLMWLGEQISAKGIGNGISLIIFTGIVARLPGAVNKLIGTVRAGDLNLVFVVFALVMFIGVVLLVIYEQQGQRKIPVHYAKRIVGRKVYGASSSYIPLKINPSGVIPVIFASSVLMFPVQISSMLGAADTAGSKIFSTIATVLSPDRPVYLILYTLMIIFFAYFYTQVTMNPIEMAKNIREHGGSIKGVRSENMEIYLKRIMDRIVLPGSLFLALIALIPSIITQVFNFPRELAYLMGGTSLLIMVGVDLDTMSQVESHLKTHHHEGLTKGGKLSSRNL